MNAKLLHADMSNPKFKGIIETKKIGIFVGANGTGKTFFLINMWCLGNLAVLASKVNTGLIEAAQFIYDRSFDHQDITGEIGLEYDSATIMVILDKGKVLDVRSIGILGKEPIPVKFMSAHMRTFDDIRLYLKFRKMITGTQEQIIDKMSETFKLYDTMYIEGLIQKCPVILDQENKERLEEHFQLKNIDSINIDLSEGNFYTDPNKKWLTTYSKGEQSIINMFIGNL